MKPVPRIAVLVALVTFGIGLLALRSKGLQWFGQSPYAPVTPEQSNVKAEFYWSRLQYTAAQGSFGGFGYRYRYGFGGGSWAQDYPKADRQFLMALRRLTRVDARPTEQVVGLDDDKIYNYPWVYAVQVQNWTFTQEEAARLRQYFLRGMRMVFPNRPIEDINNNDEIFHVLYDLGQRFQVPGEQYVVTGRTYEKDGYVPKWRAIRDDKGRIMVAICHNMHLGDAWEWADSPEYPERFASLAFRVGINYVIYGMTH
jgi:hypothetical protein